MKNSFQIKTFANNLMHSCNKVQVKEFEKNEVITTYLVNRNMFFIVLEGSADLIRYDFNGNPMVVERFNRYDVFRRNVL